MARLVITVMGAAGPPGISPSVVGIDANNTLTVNGVPTLLIQGQNMSYNTWNASAYSETQADAMIQQAVAAGVNVLGGTDLYPYTNPLYTGKTSVEVVNAKFGSLFLNATAGKPSGDEATNIRNLLASAAAPYRVAWNYFSEPDMSQYVSNLAAYRLVGSLDPAVPINCTEAIRAGTTHTYSIFFVTGASVGDGGYWDEVVHATGLQIPIVEFIQERDARKLWEYLFFMNRRVRGVSKAAPSSALTPATGSAGILTGTYKFVYTWSYGSGMLDADSTESFASPASAPITVSGSQIALSGFAAPVGTGTINLYGYKVGVSPSDGSWPTSGYSVIAAALPSTTTSYTVTTDVGSWSQATIPPKVSQLGWVPSISTTLAGELFGWSAIGTTIPTTGTLTSGSAIVTAIPSTSMLAANMVVSNPNIPVKTQIKSVDSATQVTLSQNAIASGTAQPITFTNCQTFHETRRWWWLQVAMNCRAFEWYFADWIRGPGGNDEPCIGPLSQNTKIAFASSDPADVRVCSIEGVLADGVSVTREDGITLTGTTPVQTANIYSLIKWAACHDAVASFTTTGTTVSGSAVVTGIPDTSTLRPNMTISGSRIRAASLILSVDSGTQITMTQTATSSGSGVVLTVGHAISITEVATGNTILIHLPSQTDPNKYAALVLPSGNYKGLGLALFARANDGLPNGYLQQWNDTATVVAAVKSLENVIVAPGQWQRIAAVTPTFVVYDDSHSFSNSKGLYAAKKSYGGALYVIAINWDQDNPVGFDRPLSAATIDVGQTITTCVRIAGEAGSPGFAGSVITDDFLASQVHVYRVT